MKKDWEYIKLSDACTIHGRIGWQGLTRAEHKRSGDYLLITGTDFTEDNKINLDTCVYVDEFRYTQDENIQIRKNDLLITKDGTLGKLALITEDLPKPATLNGGIFVIRDKINKLYPPFLLNYMKSDAFRKIIHNHRTGSTVPHLTQNMLVNFPIPVPPLEEQKRIVKILGEKFAQLETIKANAQTNLQNAKDLFQSQLTSVLLSNPNWTRKTLGDTVVVERGSSPRPIEQYLTTDETGVNWIKIGDTKNVDKVIYSTKEKITPEGAKKSRYVKKGDFILSNSMSLGKPYIMGTDGYIHDGWFVLRLPEDINADYFFYLLSSDFVQEQFTGLAAGAIVKNISSDLVKKSVLILPPLPEQKRIVEELDTLSEKVRQLQEIYTKQIANCDELKQSYLQKAFEGEL